MVLAYEAYVIHYASFSLLVAFLSRLDCGSFYSLSKQGPEKEHVKGGINKARRLLHDNYCQIIPQFCFLAEF